MVAVGYAAPIVVGLGRWGRLTSYHTRGARLAAWVGGLGALLVFAGGPTLPFHVAALVLACAGLEEIAITTVLPGWRADVPSLRHALRMASCAGSTRAGR